MVLLLALACSSTPHDPLAPWEDVSEGHASELQAALEGARAEQDLPGLAMAVAYLDDQQLWVGTTGSSDLEQDTAWQPEQTFRIGSVSKTFTAAAIFQLIDEGTLTLDDPIEQWVPGYWTGPTLRHLLGHSSGIASYNYIGSFDDTQPWTPDELVQWAWDREPALRFEPGSDWEYSNTNFVLLGLVLEAATGLSYEAVLEQRFFGPLALTETRLATTGDADPLLVHTYAGDPPVDTQDASDPSMGWAAGGLVSTPRDLARWQAALHGGALLSDASLSLMTTPAGLTGEGESDYGLGAFYEGEDGLVIVGHTGGIGGYATYAYSLNNPNAALVVFSNRQPTDLRAASTWGWAAILGIEYP